MSVMQSKGCTFYTFITGQTYLPKFISSRSEKKKKKNSDIQWVVE